jgi:hypothetical protein
MTLNVFRRVMEFTMLFHHRLSWPEASAGVSRVEVIGQPTMSRPLLRVTRPLTTVR